MAENKGGRPKKQIDQKEFERATKAAALLLCPT